MKPKNSADGTTPSRRGAEVLARRARSGFTTGRLFHEAVRDALREHKRRGESIVVWQNGAVVTIPPEDIAVDDHL